MGHKYDLDGIPRRDTERFPEVETVPKKTPGKKNKRKWCRGKVGVEHVLEVRLSKWEKYFRSTHPGWDGCANPRPFLHGNWKPKWCGHEKACVNCGKILHWSLPRSECPEIIAR